MGRGQGRLNVSFVKDLKSYQAPHEVISLAEFIASDQPNHFTSVGDIVYLVGADEGNNQERCYLIEENDPVQAIEGLG